MIGYVGRAAGRGAFYLGALSLLAGLLMSFNWSFVGQSGDMGGFVMLLVMFVPAMAIGGALAGLALFAVAGVLVRASGVSPAGAIPVYAILGGLLSLLILLPFTSWVAGGIGPALAGAKGSYLALVPGLGSAIIAGALVGSAMSRYSRA